MDVVEDAVATASEAGPAPDAPSVPSAVADINAALAQLDRLVGLAEASLGPLPQGADLPPLPASSLPASFSSLMPLGASSFTTAVGVTISDSSGSQPTSSTPRGGAVSGPIPQTPRGGPVPSTPRGGPIPTTPRGGVRPGSLAARMAALSTRALTGLGLDPEPNVRRGETATAFAPLAPVSLPTASLLSFPSSEGARCVCVYARL